MSREALDLVIRGVRAATRTPKPDFDTVNELFSPDHVLVSVLADKLGEGEAKGGRGYRDWLDSLDESMPFEQDFEGAVDIGPNVVLIVTTVRMHGATSGLATEQRMWSVVWVDGGQIVRTEAYLNPAEALAAADATG